MHNSTNSAGQELVNWDEGLKRVAGNRALFEKLLHRIAGDLPNDLKAIEQGLASGDMESVGQVAHSIKGAAGNLSISGIYQLAIDLETAAREGNATQATEILEKLRESAVQLTGYLKSL